MFRFHSGKTERLQKPFCRNTFLLLSYLRVQLGLWVLEHLVRLWDLVCLGVLLGQLGRQDLLVQVHHALLFDHGDLGDLGSQLCRVRRVCGILFRVLCNLQKKMKDIR